MNALKLIVVKHGNIIPVFSVSRKIHVYCVKIKTRLFCAKYNKSNVINLTVVIHGNVIPMFSVSHRKYTKENY